MKKFWHQYRIFIILMGIIAILLFFKSGKDKYGDRLDGIKKVTITEKMKDTIIAESNKDEKVKNTKIDVKGKIIYVTIYLENVSSVIEAQGKAVNSLSAISDDIKKKYDVQFIVIQEKTDTNPEIKIMGCQNVLGSGLVWNNNTNFEESEE